MILLDQIREAKLIELAKTRFDPPPTEAEEKVLRDSASSSDPDMPADGSLRPEIRPEFVRWLATDPEATTHIDAKGLRAYGFTLPGQLALQNCRILVTLDFRRCTIVGEINLQGADMKRLLIKDSSLEKGICADDVDVQGSLTFQNCIFSIGARISDARIHGGLSFFGSKLTAEGGALSAWRTEIEGAVILCGGFESTGIVNLAGVKIKNGLDCSGAKLLVKAGDAFIADGAEIGGGAFFIDGFESSGTVRMFGARINGVVNFIGAKLHAITGHALLAENAEIGGHVFLSDGFESSATIRLMGAQIKGQLNCTGAKLRTAQRDALNADNTEIGGSVFLNYGFESSGIIRLMDAQIKGSLYCEAAKFLVKDGDALGLWGARIKGSVLLTNGFESSGPIRLNDAQIDGTLDCSGAKLLGNTGDALTAQNAEIIGNISLSKGFESQGIISLHSARVGGQLAFHGAKVAKVDCTNLHLTGDMLWMVVVKSEATFLDLTGAQVRNLHYDRESWPEKGHLILDGFIYEELSCHKRLSLPMNSLHAFAWELPLNVEECINWLMLQPSARLIEPQPWIQLSKHLEGKGDRKGARHVVFKYRCFLAQRHSLLFRLWGIALAWLEEMPLRILWSYMFTFFVGTLIFTGAYRSGAMIASIQIQPDAVSSNGESKPLSIHYPPFHPFIYAMEIALPLSALSKLGMDEQWMPDPKHKPQPWFPRIGWLDGLKWFNSYEFLISFRWSQLVWGWIMASFLTAWLASGFRK